MTPRNLATLALLALVVSGCGESTQPVLRIEFHPDGSLKKCESLYSVYGCNVILKQQQHEENCWGGGCDAD